MSSSSSPASPLFHKAAEWPIAPRFALLNVGLILYGLGLSLMIAANIGLAPWDAFHVGLARKLPGVAVGTASIGVGIFVIAAAAWWLKVKIGIGSVLNTVLIGVYINLLLPHLRAPSWIALAWGQFAVGVALVGLATGTYIASGFGAGPRDSLVLGLNAKTGWPVKWLRTGIEILVLLSGWLLGAKVGWGTLAFALGIGPAMSLGMGLFGLKR